MRASNHFRLSLTNTTLPKMKTIITSVIASILLFPTLAQAGVRDQYNQSTQQESTRNASCLKLWNEAQFKLNSDFRYHVDRVGNIKHMWNGNMFASNGACGYREEGMVNVEQHDGHLTTYSYHIEDEGLVMYSSMQAIPKPVLNRRVFSFR